MTREELNLAMAPRHAAEAEECVESQLDRIARLREIGGDVALAEAVLAVLTVSLTRARHDQQLALAAVMEQRGVLP